MKAWRVDSQAVGILLVWADTRSAARYQCFAAAKDAGFEYYRFGGIGRVVRAPEYDDHPRQRKGCFDPCSFVPTAVWNKQKEPV